MIMKLHELTIVEAHNALVHKDISTVELVTACIARIYSIDNRINAFITILDEEALAQAHTIDAKIAAGEKIGMLTGIPYSAKDVIMTEGVRTTAGSNMLREFIPPFNATVIEHLNQAGAILIGKTNCDAYGHGSSTENSDFFVTRNPHDTTRVAGGSSGGAAAAVALGMGLFALGEDTGGSIRQPASFCGITGLKVSYGRVSRYGIIAYASSLDTVGPLTKNAEDCAIVLSAIAGRDNRDHTTVHETPTDYYAAIKKKDMHGLRIGIPVEYFTKDLDREVNNIVMEAVRKLKVQGCVIEEVSLPLTSVAIPTYYSIAASETSANLARLDGIRFGHRTTLAQSTEEVFKQSRMEGLGAEAQRRIMLGTYALSAGYHDEYYKKAQKVRTLLRKEFESAFKKVDVLICPTSPFTAFRIGEKSANPAEMYLADIYTTAFSLAGLPTINVPCGYISDLPVGMQIAGPYTDEMTVLQVAAAFEQVTDWHKKRPSIS